jgi:two-component system, chemotaxis family, CheB/CheR fusion protein
MEKLQITTEKVRVVGIGASAGGLDALKDFFRAMPNDTGMAFVIIQHLDPHQVSHLPSVLVKYTQMAVVHAKHHVMVEANCIYTIPPNKFLSIRNNKLQLSETFKSNSLRLPIDFFFHSLAQEYNHEAIAVLLSGGGSDGSIGIREIRSEGGIVMVQDPATAQFDPMIRNALATGLVDGVLPVAQIPAAILQCVSQESHGDEDLDPESVQNEVQSILTLFDQENKGYFKSYKKTMLSRRIRRRMGLNQLTSLSEYMSLLRINPEEQLRLSKDMLIGVTTFFRDYKAFDSLRERAILPLLQGKQSGDSLRAWIVGCSTGEEAYSIIISFMEEMRRIKNTLSLRIIASDLDSESLKFARAGIYPDSIISHVSEERLARFFTKKDHSYQVNKEVRDCVTFAPHNILVDPAFLKMDLISCRNLLIYIEPEIQQRILSQFAYSLNLGGYLFLGKADTSVDQERSFESVSRTARIYRRTGTAGMPLSNLPLHMTMTLDRQGRAEKKPSFKLSDLNRDVVLKHFNAAVVLVDEQGVIAHFYGSTAKYLQHQSGIATLNLFEMVARHSFRLRLAVEKAFRENLTVTLARVKFDRDGSDCPVDITVTLCEPQKGAKFVAVLFQDAALTQTGQGVEDMPNQSLSSDTDQLIKRLESEIKSLKDELSATNEGFQMSHEELSAGNEETQAINEELHSTNEELETSKEELQSVNEELITVNNQLNEKLIELNQSNDDLANFLNSSEMGTVFLDSQYRIRRFTPSTTKLLNLLSIDEGRPIEHITTRLIGIDLVALAKTVLRTLHPIEKQAATTDGGWYLIRCLPYRTHGNEIEGVVLTFTDVAQLKRSEEAMRHAHLFTENIFNTIRESLLVLDPALKVVSANRAFYSTFGVSPNETIDCLLFELGNHQWNIPRVRELLQATSDGKETSESFELQHYFPGIGEKIMSLNAKRIYSGEHHSSDFILLAIEDITERRRLELKMRQNEHLAALGLAVAQISHEIRNPLNAMYTTTQVLDSYFRKNKKNIDQRVIEISADQLAEIKRLKSLLDDLRTVSPPSLQNLNLEETNVGLLALDVLQREKINWAERIQIEHNISPDLPMVMVDRDKMNQVFLNLYKNAAEATSGKGRVMIRAYRSGAAICVEIADSGAGVPADVNLLKYSSELEQGMGFGLMVVERIIAAHEGSISYTSTVGKGTTFLIQLPLHSPTKPRL